MKKEVGKNNLIIANWKMNLTILEGSLLVHQLDQITTNHRNVDVVFAPSHLSLQSLNLQIDHDKFALAAQNFYWRDEGAFTGEVSAAMLREFGARYVLVGHSERRQLHGETDACVAAKAQRALAAGITPIVCVGETLAEREAGQTEAVVRRQLAAVIHVNGRCISEVVVAYEPVWAIGTGLTATPAQAQEVHAALRTQLAAASQNAAGMRLLYGGSMNAANAADLLAQTDIDGGLVGGASLKAADFLSIISAAQPAPRTN